MLDREIMRCREEQAAALCAIASTSGDEYAWRWLEDWIVEELLVLDECGAIQPVPGAKP